MQVQKFENEKVVAYVHYNNLPTKEDLEEACMIFMRKAMQELKEKEEKKEHGKQRVTGNEL